MPREVADLQSGKTELLADLKRVEIELFLCGFPSWLPVWVVACAMPAAVGVGKLVGRAEPRELVQAVFRKTQITVQAVPIRSTELPQCF